MIITHSEISTLFRCPKAHYFQYIRGLRPKRPVEFLTESIAGHDALECFYKTGDVGEAMKSYDAAFDDARDKLGDDFGRLHETRFQRMRALVIAYFDTFESKDKTEWEFEEVEYEFELPVRHPDNPEVVLEDARFCGKIDGIWRQKTGRRLRHIVEHKFLSQFDPNRNSLSIDQQVSLYSLAAIERFGVDTPVILYNVSKKPVNQMKQTEDPHEFFHRVRSSILEKPEKYFHRIPLYRDPSWIQEARKILWVGANMIKNGEPQYKFRNVGLHCTQLCRFGELCYDENPIMIDALFEKKPKLHGELNISE